MTAKLSDGTPPVVETVQFTGRGCTLSQATASLLTEQMIGTPVTDIVEWNSETLEDLVGMDLTPSRLRCAELATRRVPERRRGPLADWHWPFVNPRTLGVGR